MRHNWPAAAVVFHADFPRHTPVAWDWGAPELCCFPQEGKKSAVQEAWRHFLPKLSHMFIRISSDGITIFLASSPFLTCFRACYNDSPDIRPAIGIIPRILTMIPGFGRTVRSSRNLPRLSIYIA